MRAIVLLSAVVLLAALASGQSPPAAPTTSLTPNRTYNGAGGGYIYATANNFSYTCPATEPTGRSVSCVVAQYPAGANEGATATVQCPTGEMVSCFLFASYGEVGGSCIAPFDLKENPETASWIHVPAAVITAANCVGQNSCSFTVGVDSSNLGTINGVSTGVQDLVHPGSKIKLLAVCRPSSAPTPSSAAGHGLATVAALMLLLVVA